ncbi:MAG: hypothetical protein IKN55_03490 [Oscillospiraceae bacterium]|nr:hypothetical protein [Oscillospiraceae bacterium]
MICPKCQTEYEGDHCPECGRVVLEKPSAEAAEAPEAPAPEAAAAAAVEVSVPGTAPASKEPVALYAALAIAGTVVLAVMSASMLIPKLIMGDSGVKPQHRGDASTGTFSLPDDVREREESRHAKEKQRKADAEHEKGGHEDADSFGGLKAGAYKVGEDLPPGRYLLISDDYNISGDDGMRYGDFHYAVYSTYTMTESRKIGGGWIKNTAYVEVEDGQSLEFSFATLVTEDAFDPDPFWKSGMFLVGKDVKPGTYSVVAVDNQYSGMFWVYDRIPSDTSATQILDEGYIGMSGEAEEVTLEEGQVLVTDFCILQS